MDGLTIWLLLVVGTGASYSQPTVVHRYKHEEVCKADGDRIKKRFYADYLCLRVTVPLS